jgi:CDP-diacylglycerol--glycerol-3-phosphate 3-phosphatidyltransferase
VTGALGRRDERIDTVANGVTLARTVAATVLALLALGHGSLRLLVAAYLVYWVGDILDGHVARALGQETRIGAVFDIVSDRTCTTLCAAAFVVVSPQVLVPITVFLVQFCVVDTMLSLTFLCFPIKGPNDFHQVDRTLHRWNWSPAAKALNTSVVVLLSVAGMPLAATVCALAVLGVKVWSVRYLVTTVLPLRQQPVA